MGKENGQSNNGRGTLDTIVAIIVIVGIFLLFRYIWHGIIWAFNEYIELLKVK